MQSTEREKICVSCEGRIALDATVCPFCASDQASDKMSQTFQQPLFQDQSLEDSLTSLYTPPYQGKKPQFSQEIEGEPEQIDGFESEEEISAELPMETPEQISDEKESPKSLQKKLQKSLWAPTLLLAGGIQLGILGLMQLLFSKNGILRLEWNASLWFLPLLIAAPLIYFGYKKLLADSE